AAVDIRTRQIAEQLHRAWDSRRPAARTAADTVHSGSGRLGQHRRAVRHAADHLQQWVDTSRPILPDLPNDPGAIAAVAASFDYMTRLHGVFTRHSRHTA